MKKDKHAFYMNKFHNSSMVAIEYHQSVVALGTL
jgi:hypothetical protein